MSFVSFAKREISFKIVYYGPPLCGKTTNLEYLHRVMPAKSRGPMTILSTREDRTLYFDFLPLQSKAIKGFVSKFQLYTVPGQTIYNDTRRLVLNAADGVVFVADSQWSQMENNVESLQNLHANLRTYQLQLAELPHVFQCNKRDLPGVAPLHYIDFLLNRGSKRMPTFESVATTGVGVYETLNMVAKMVMAKFIEDHQMSIDAVPETSQRATEANG
jgi:signal recognition particle receptor subunit beta